MQRIVVLNPKGGSGKTTIAINLASYFAVQGLRPVLMDYDPQGSSMRWLKKRTAPQPLIHGVAAYERNTRTTRSFLLRVPADARRQVIDTPAAIDATEMPELTRGADAILVPVLPSDIDIHACSKCIADLLLVAKVRRSENRIAVIANRVRKHTLIYQSLMRFLASLNIPIVATFRDSQNYIRAAELGVGIHEMKPYLVREDVEQWGPLVEWLNTRLAGYPAATATVTAAPAEPIAAPVMAPPAQPALAGPSAATRPTAPGLNVSPLMAAAKAMSVVAPASPPPADPPLETAPPEEDIPKEVVPTNPTMLTAAAEIESKAAAAMAEALAEIEAKAAAAIDRILHGEREEIEEQPTDNAAGATSR
jgi:chromosome partitioning protein